ncbi:MAG: cation diffusion facilitator family transporter [Treponema sp.]|jgi:cation diffusion facilitator family transporter|nr:cation diffusion facilitator family transporter [Treponema sp.]
MAGLEIDKRTENRAAFIRVASFAALFGNLALGVLKICSGIWGNSLAVLGDGIDSSVDILIALMALVVSRIISRPADRGHPWGHGRAETVATALLAFFLFFAGAQLVLNSLTNLVLGKPRDLPGKVAVIATLISVAGKLVLALVQYYFGKKADSAMLRANAKNMTGDVMLSLGVLAGLGLSIETGIASIDSATAILVGIWVIRSAVGIFTEANLELMDGSAETESYRAVFDAVHSVEGAGNPHRTRMRRIAGLWDIDIDIEVDPNLTVRQAHRIATQVETAIKRRVEGIYDIMVHVEPSGDHHPENTEGFGLNETAIGEHEK